MIRFRIGDHTFTLSGGTLRGGDAYHRRMLRKLMAHPRPVLDYFPDSDQRHIVAIQDVFPELVVLRYTPPPDDGLPPGTIYSQQVTSVKFG